MNKEQTIEEKQPFEHFEDLKESILFGANTWLIQSGWTEHLSLINKYCTQLLSKNKDVVDLKMELSNYVHANKIENKLRMQQQEVSANLWNENESLKSKIQSKEEECKELKETENERRKTLIQLQLDYGIAKSELNSKEEMLEKATIYLKSSLAITSVVATQLNGDIAVKTHIKNLGDFLSNFKQEKKEK